MLIITLNLSPPLTPDAQGDEVEKDIQVCAIGPDKQDRSGHLSPSDRTQCGRWRFATVYTLGLEGIVSKRLTAP
jgi:hypothetical protein